jgi:HlyD family secretion protein
MMRAMFPLLSCVVLTACSSAQSNDVPPRKASPYFTTAVGRVDSEEEARQLVAATDGVIKALYVSRGQTVAAGQALLKVDCAPRIAETNARYAEANRANAAARIVYEGARGEEIVAGQANLAAAQSALLNQQQRLDQASKLIADGYISRRELDARTNERDAAKASVQAASAKLDQLRNGARQSERVEASAAANAALGQARTARALADQCVLESPIRGQVLQILRREGEFSGASQGTPLIVVGNLAQLTVRAEINERDAARVLPGQRADIWIEGQPKRWSGTVTHLASIMGRRSARSLDPTDRFDRDVREAFIAFDEETPPALVGLRVTVGIKKKEGV